MSLLFFLLSIDENNNSNTEGAEAHGFFGVFAFICYITALVVSAIVIFIWSTRDSATDVSPLVSKDPENELELDDEENVNIE